MEPFAEKPIDNLASTSLCIEPLEANGGVAGGASHNSIFNSIRNFRKRHGRETAEITKWMDAFTSAQRMHRGQ